MNTSSSSSLVKDSVLIRFWLTLVIIILFQIIVFFTVKITILTFSIYILLAILINIIDWYFKYFVVKRSIQFYKSYIWYWVILKLFQHLTIEVNYFIKLKQEKVHCVDTSSKFVSLVRLIITLF